jgi:hypothetical protein
VIRRTIPSPNIRSRVARRFASRLGGLTDPSAQDFYLGDWQASGPGGAGADAERGILAGVAGGIQASRLSTAAGIGVGDPDLEQALDLLHSLQDPATGGFIAPPESFGVGLNADTTSWVTSGLVQCGIDPQGPEWRTAEGMTPLDYLVSMQRPDGHFDWTEEYAGGAFEAYSSVRPLGGVAFSSPPPARLDGVSPALRPAAEVADGTVVPITLVIDHGPGAAKVADLRPAPKVMVPALRPVERPSHRGPRISFRGEARWSDGGVEVELRCPRGLGNSGCRGLLSAQFRKQPGGRLLAGGSAAFAVVSGSWDELTIPATATLRKRLADGRRLKLRLTAATRDEAGAVRLTHAKRFLAG